MEPGTIQFADVQTSSAPEIDTFAEKLAVLLRDTAIEVENSKYEIPTSTGKGSSWAAQNWK